MKKLTIRAMQQLAESHRGKCLSDTYVDANSKLSWQCAKGHQWDAVPNSIKRGTWCPECSGNARLTIEHMHRLAESRGGRCVSDVYVDAHSQLTWRCAEGHQWTATPNHIQQGKWCPDCSGHARLTIHKMHRLAEARGGRCLSDIYANARSKLIWECSKGHQWTATPNHIQQGKWCPECSGHARLTIQEMHSLAQDRGGKCLSDIYVNDRTPLLWECKDGHKWEAIPDSVKRGTWCLTCSDGLGERICREFFSQLFDKPYPKSRPGWLINSAGNQMELDGYCAALGIAFEHQGEQHYSTKVHFFHGRHDLSRWQKDDALKSELCSQRGITLVSVPEIPRLLPLDQVKAFIKEQLGARGIPLPQDYDTRDVDINKAYRTGGSRETLDSLRAIATEHGGKCLSDIYVGSHSKLLWQCAQGHNWEATPASIKSGSWCPVCGNRRKGRRKAR